MKKAFLFCLVVFATFFSRAQSQVIVNSKNIDSTLQLKIQSNFDRIFNDLTRLSKYFDTLNVQKVDTNIYLPNRALLNSLSSQISQSLNVLKQESISIFHNNNSYYENKLKEASEKITELQVRLKQLSETDYKELAKELTKYWTIVDSLKLENKELDSLYNYYKIKSTNADSIIIVNRVYKEQLDIYTQTAIDWGLSATAFWDPKGVFYYEVNSDSTVTEYSTDGYGGMLSFVLMFRFAELKSKNTELYGVVNMPIIDISSATGTSLFNKKTQLGLGIGMRTGPILTSLIINLSNVQRLTKSKRQSNSFYTETPYEKLNLDNYSSYLVDEPKVLINFGVVIPVGYLLKKSQADKVKQ